MKGKIGTRDTDRGQIGDSGAVAIILTIVIAAAIGFIGVDVTSSIDDSTDVAANSDYDFAQDNVSTGFTDAMGLVDIVFIVLMFSVILGALLSFRRMRG